MELVELLDKIDENAPKGCRFCRHMATHAKCNGCLGDANHYEYRNYEPGNWLRDQQSAEEESRIEIHVAGECDMFANWTPEQTSKHFHYVAGECGYMCTPLHHRERDADRFGDTVLEIYTPDGRFSIWWKLGKLFQIWQLNQEGNPISLHWPRF